MEPPSLLRRGWPDLEEIRQPNAERHAAHGDMVKSETGSRIQIWQTVAFRSRK